MGTGPEEEEKKILDYRSTPFGGSIAKIAEDPNAITDTCARVASVSTFQ
jgi:hypothetical protein